MDNYTTTHKYTDNNGTVQVTAALPDAGWRPVAEASTGEALLPLVLASTLRVALWEYEYNDERQHYSIYPRTGSPNPPGLPRTQPSPRLSESCGQHIRSHAQCCERTAHLPYEGRFR